MRQFYLDVVAPSVSEMLSYFIRDNAVLVILLLVVLLMIAVSVVNICVLKRKSKTTSDESDPTNAEKKK